MEPIRLSVRKLVEHVMRGGDIDNRYADSSAMLQGARAHRMLQKAMGEGYRKEVSLQCAAMAGDVPVVVFGRADGIFPGPDGAPAVDEIKTTTLPLPRFMEQRELHLAQAKCYAHMLLLAGESPPASILIQLTYYQLETKETQRLCFYYTPEELAAFFAGLLEAYALWLRYERDWQETRQASIRALPFPYAGYRPGQRKLAVAAYTAIESRKRLYAQAPTGIGKTISALFPSIKAMGEGKAEKLFYLTAKTVTRAVAEDAVRRMAAHGLRLKSLTLRAKEKICFCEAPNCNPEYCAYAKGHYDRVQDALYAMLTGEDLLTPEVVEAYARQHRVCPHEFALDASEWADLVIGDYNHVFDPKVYLRRFFAEGAGADYVFLIDEAHNMPDRVREMYTASISKAAFGTLARQFKEKSGPAARMKKNMSAINRHLLALRKECEAAEERVRSGGAPDSTLTGLVAQFVLEAQDWLYAVRHSAHPLQEELLGLYFEASFFLEIAALFGEPFATIQEKWGSDFRYTLYCLDPSGIIAERLRLARAAVLFSATLTPLPYYRELLGGDAEDGMLELRSPFAAERLRLLAHTGVSTKYVDRAGSVAPIVEAIRLAVARQRGNYIAYFPSYEYMEEVYAAFTQTCPETRTLLQEGRMEESARAAFMAQFDAANAQTLVGFCVLGGIFSEGIDLVGDRLVGAIIVGVGLPRISLRQDLIRNYYNEKNGQGFAYAYVYPGMNKVLQAAGRVIRSEEDSGLVLLIDSRFGTAQYRALFPAHWSHMQSARSLQGLALLLEEHSV